MNLAATGRSYLGHHGKMVMWSGTVIVAHQIGRLNGQENIWQFHETELALEPGLQIL